jgi:putative hydrolase
MNKLSTPVFPKFNEITPESAAFDFHMHTRWSDGADGVADMVAAARDERLHAIAITDHVNRQCPWYTGFCEDVRAVRRDASLAVYVGLEAKALDFDGTLDASDDVVAQAELVIGSVHRYPDGRGGLVPLRDVGSMGTVAAGRTEFGLALGLVRNRANGIHVLGHPFGVYSTFFEDVPEQHIEELAAACAEFGVAFEISTKCCRDFPRTAAVLRNVNPPVSIGSDAHRRAGVAQNYSVLREEIARWR